MSDNMKEWVKREQKAIDDQACILVSELREWCEARMKENEENIEFLSGSNDYEDIEDSIGSSAQNDLIQDILTKFCGGK